MEASATGVEKMDTLPPSVRMLKIRAFKIQKSFKSSFSLSRGLKRDRHLAKKGGRNFPKGLMGPPFVVHLSVNGQQCDAVLDSGSQVTIISVEWYKQHLSDVPIDPVSGLAIWGLSETSYPYLGYVVVDVEFPESVTLRLSIDLPWPQNSKPDSCYPGHQCQSL